MYNENIFFEFLLNTIQKSKDIFDKTWNLTI